MKPRFRNIFIVPLIILITSLKAYSQQKVGLVLSGGGATGLAHIGVLKALEENGIKIDYITGTSSGALVGALYAAGFSPQEIEAYVLSPEFQLITKGKNTTNQRFLIREEEENASLIDLEFSAKTPLINSLPTSLISSSYLDFEMFRMLGLASAEANDDFDSLFIPFRCISSDITSKKSVVFSKGNLNEAVRTSITFPFYLNPIKINDQLLFDGGLYNNFPADIMYYEFNPDYIIGSNVSGNASPPHEDDLIGQVINMLVFQSTFNLPCETGIIIEPKSTVTTFDFENVQQAINAGYLSTIEKINTIKSNISQLYTLEEIQKNRGLYRENLTQIYITKIETQSFDKNKKVSYAEKSLINPKKENYLTLNQFEKRYFRLYNSQQIEFIYPTISKIQDSLYSVKLKIKKSKDFKLQVGGHFSSRSVNTGYLGLTFKQLSKTATSIKAESYFGKFYGSLRTIGSIDIPSRYPITFSGYFVLNRWDYFRNFSTFFEKVKPSFLVQNELYYGVQIEHPIGNNQKSTLDFRFFSLEDDYYQSLNFANTDTTDKTYFYGSSIRWEFLKTSLNRKQFASSGSMISFKAKYINGKEHFIRGSKNLSYDKEYFADHNWMSLNLNIQSFFIDQPRFHLGFQFNSVFNTQSLFYNYTSSLLAMSSFSPIPDVETFFLPEYRSPQHIGTGLNIIFSVKKKVDFRLDAFYYQPFVNLTKKDDTGEFGYSKPFKGKEFLTSTSIIYHSYFGPLRATLNYFPDQLTPLSFQVSFGYVLFNERAIR